MVQYEVALILRSVPTAELSQLLKKTLSVVLDQGAVLRKVENLGERQLPYRMRAHSKYFQDGRQVHPLLTLAAECCTNLSDVMVRSISGSRSDDNLTESSHAGSFLWRLNSLSYFHECKYSVIEVCSLCRYLVFNIDASPQMAITIRNKLRANADTIRTTLLKGGA